MSRNKPKIVLTLLFIMVAPAVIWSGDIKNDGDLATLADWMTGSFSSRQQSLEDTSFYDIRLEMARIWPERTDGYWLYVEQAVAGNTENPYRQRVYRVTRLDDSTFESAVFTFDDPLRFAGVWKNPITPEGLLPDSLVEKSGCSVYLRRESDSVFTGGTTVGTCKSSLRGATYAVSEVTVTPELLISWDRGYDSDGNQVWGARTGGYLFRKATDKK